MQINKEVLERVAKNARLNLSKEEEKKFLVEMEEVLKSFSKLDEIDTKNVKGVIQPVESRNIMRNDSSRICLKENDVFKNTKYKKENYFIGPKAI